MAYPDEPFRRVEGLVLPASPRSAAKDAMRAGSVPKPTSEVMDLRQAVSDGERPEGERWYVARTLPNREAGAASQLEAQGFRVFLPRIARTVRHARKMRNVRAPAFPGYLFVALDLSRDRWRSVNGTFGVARLIMADELPMPVPRGVVEAILDTVDETGVCQFNRGLAVGQRVRVMSGPFAEQLGDLVRLDGPGRVRVLLEIMGGKVPATVQSSALVAA